MARSHGYRRGSRSHLTRSPGSRSGSSPDILLRSYKLGDRVVIKLEPSVLKGMPHHRYHGKIGKVIEKRGRGYIIEIVEGGKTRRITTRPEHLAQWK